MDPSLAKTPVATSTPGNSRTGTSQSSGPGSGSEPRSASKASTAAKGPDASSSSATTTARTGTTPKASSSTASASSSTTPTPTPTPNKKTKPRKKPSSTKPQSKTKSKSKTGTSKTNASSSSKGGASTSASTTSNPIMSAAALTKKAKNLFEKLKQEKEYTFHDQAWLSSSTNTTARTQQQHPLAVFSPSFLESDVEIIQKALKNNGLNPSDVSLEAFGCLLESARKYALEIIDDATEYSMLGGGGGDGSDTATIMQGITCADLKFAQEMYHDENSTSSFDYNTIGTNTNSTYSTHLNRNGPEQLYHLSQIADHVNKMIIPPIPDECYNGIVLPPPEHSLLGQTFDVVVSQNRRRTSNSNGGVGVGGGDDQNNNNKNDMVDASGDVIMGNTDVAATASASATNGKEQQHKATYGAHRGTQIQINLTTSK